MDRIAAYTTPRPDVAALVPVDSRLILDLGCSDGSLGASLLKLRPGAQVYGVEGDTELGAIAKSRLTNAIVADLNANDCLQSLEGIRFDCIIAADVLEHLISPEKLLAKLHRYLTKNGCVVISLPNIRHHSALIAIYGGGQFPRRDRGIFDRTHLHWFTLRDAKTMLRNAGFETEKENYSLRFGDQGGGVVNRIGRKLLSPVQSFTPVREFMTYQFAIRARPTNKAT